MYDETCGNGSEDFLFSTSALDGYESLTSCSGLLVPGDHYIPIWVAQNVVMVNFYRLPVNKWKWAILSTENSDLYMFSMNTQSKYIHLTFIWFSGRYGNYY
jgi:hypothetical protein